MGCIRRFMGKRENAWTAEKTQPPLRDTKNFYVSAISRQFVFALLCHWIAVWACHFIPLRFSLVVFSTSNGLHQTSTHAPPGLHKGRTREARRRASRSIAP